MMENDRQKPLGGTQLSVDKRILGPRVARLRKTHKEMAEELMRDKSLDVRPLTPYRVRLKLKLIASQDEGRAVLKQLQKLRKRKKREDVEEEEDERTMKRKKRRRRRKMISGKQ